MAFSLYGVEGRRPCCFSTVEFRPALPHRTSSFHHIRRSIQLLSLHFRIFFSFGSGSILPSLRFLMRNV